MRLHVALSVLALTLVTPSPARTQAGSHVEALVRMRQAAAARVRGDLDEAGRLLEESLALGGPPQALRELAQTREAQHRWRDAAAAWTRYSALASTDADRSSALERREALRRMLTALLVRVEPPLAARVSRVWFDREPPRWYAAGGVEQVAEGGSHRVRVEAAGYEAWERMIPTSFGEPVRVVAVMVRARSADAGVDAR